VDVTESDRVDASEELRAAMVAELRARGDIRSERVAEAMLAVPRHAYVPEAELAHAYAADEVVIIKTGERGQALSSASAPCVVAGMLEQLDVRPGERVLEIGAGTGWNAALLAHLVGPAGRVVTVEFDPQVADRARAALVAEGVGGVEVVTADGHLGYAEGGQYQRIIVTAGAFDVAPAWIAQLADEGRLVVPLRLPWHMTVAFQHVGGGVLRSVSAVTAGFIPLAGPQAHVEGCVEIGESAVLVRLHDQGADARALKGVLSHPPAEAWSGVVVDDGPSWEHLYLWLMATTPGVCKFNITPEGAASGLLRPLLSWGGAAFHEGGNFAYLTNRRGVGGHPEAPRYEVGVIGHGPQGEQLAARIASRLRAWDAGPRAMPEPWIELHPAGTPDDRLSGRILDRHHHRLTVVTAEHG